jgi:Tol biopolymer transport system component
LGAEEELRECAITADGLPENCQIMRTNHIKSLLCAFALGLIVAGTFTHTAQAQTTTARIAYQNLVTVKGKGGSASYNQLFSMNPDGTGVTQLTSGAVSSFYPTWSPGQQYLAFERNGAIWVMDAVGEANGGHSFAVTASRNFGLDWSPDGSKIAYTGTSAALGLWTVSVNTATGQVGTSTLVRSGEIYWPAWSPDGGRIAFCSSYDGGTTQVVIVLDLATGAETSFGVGPVGSYNFQPEWKPDGSQIVFTGPSFFTTTVRGKTSTSYYNQVFIANADGSSITQVTHLSSDCGRPTWSPDGAAVAFGTGVSGTAGIYQIQLPAGVVSLVHSPGATPNWYP